MPWVLAFLAIAAVVFPMLLHRAGRIAAAAEQSAF